MATVDPNKSPEMSVETARRLVQRYRRDPEVWGKEVVGIRFSRQQRDALKQMMDNSKPNGGTGKLLIKSGYGTGKTWLAAFIGLWYVCCHRDATVLFMSSSGTHVETKLFAWFRQLYFRSKFKLGGELLSRSLRFGNIWSATAVSPSNPDNFQGSHAENLLIVFDEAQSVLPEFWDAAEGMQQGSNAMIVGIFNPFYTDCRAAENWKKTDEWARRTFSSLEHENVTEGRVVFPGAVTREWIEDRRRQWGEDSPMWRTRVEGEFPLTSDTALLTIYDLESALKQFTRIPDGKHLGVDIARFGNDDSVATYTEDREVKAQYSWSGFDLMRSCGEITRIVKAHKIPWDHVNIDVCGMGSGVCDRLLELEHPVNAVDFGGGPVGDWSDHPEIRGLEFLNRRAELHWVLRQLVRSGAYKIPGKYSQAWGDLTAIRYKTRSDGKIQIEAKEDFKRRMGRSPDAGDSVVYTCSRQAAPIMLWSGGGDEDATDGGEAPE